MLFVGRNRVVVSKHKKGRTTLQQAVRPSQTAPENRGHSGPASRLVWLFLTYGPAHMVRVVFDYIRNILFIKFLSS
jgi:hypothetical protein